MSSAISSCCAATASPKSILGFEPLASPSPRGCTEGLARTRSLLSELLAGGPEDLLNESGDEEEDSLLDCTTCTCGAGPGVPAAQHHAACGKPVRIVQALSGTEVGRGPQLQRALLGAAGPWGMCPSAAGAQQQQDAALAPSPSRAIDVPTTSYYKTRIQVQQRNELQYKRQYYRMQLELQEQQQRGIAVEDQM